jgi:hypothetical protein
LGGRPGFFGGKPIFWIALQVGETPGDGIIPLELSANGSEEI